MTTYHAYHPVQNKSSCRIMRAIVERRYTVVLPTLKAFLEVSSSAWVQRANWLKRKENTKKFNSRLQASYILVIHVYFLPLTNHDSC